ncbi:MAG: peptide chain release factor N(5)-glutamine methyltransferase [Brevinematia bacterium]
MKLGDLFNYCVDTLRKAGLPTPKTDSELIISDVLNIRRFEIYVRGDLEIDDDQLEKVLSFIERRKEFEPLEYILGYKYFWGMKFRVKEGVLIPRFETESLIEFIKNTCRNINYILDIGTGTGILGITLKKIFPNAYVVMTDISDVSLEVCRYNVSSLLGEIEGVELIKSDIFDNIWEEIGWGKFDLIVSNPPYISERDYVFLPKDVKKEPYIALYGGILGMDFYIKIANRVRDFLSSRGRVILEVGDEEQAEKVKRIFRLKGFRNFVTFRDINNLVRGVAAINFG